MKVAEVSSEACKINDDGVYFLIIYMNEARKKLWSQGVDIETIQEKMKGALEKLNSIYRPGEGLGKT